MILIQLYVVRHSGGTFQNSSASLFISRVVVHGTLNDVGKQFSPRTGSSLLANRISYRNLNKQRNITPKIFKKGTGVVQLIIMGNFIRLKWVSIPNDRVMS